MWNTVSARRQSTISALSNSVRVANPTGKTLGARSSGQPALTTRAAAGPLAISPIWRCETSTRLCAVPSSTDSSTPAIVPASASSAIRSHSSGPSHSAARLSPSLAKPRREGSSAPNAIPQATRTASPPRRMNRAAGGASTSANRGPSGRGPSRGERARTATSAIETRSSLVIEDRGDDRRPDRAAGHRDMELRAQARSAGGDHGERDRAAQSRAQVGRSDMAERGRAGWRARAFRHLRALFEHESRIVGQKSDELVAIGREHIRARERPLADEVLLRFADRPVETEIGERRRAVGVLADDDIALLGPHDMHRLGAIGAAVLLPDLAPRRLPDRSAIVRGNVDLVAQFPGEADTHQPRLNAARARFPHAHVRKRFVRQIGALNERRSFRAPAGPARRSSPIARSRK